ncbi:MAG: VOC family protein [Kofleriaceae bacterium]
MTRRATCPRRRDETRKICASAGLVASESDGRVGASTPCGAIVCIVRAVLGGTYEDKARLSIVILAVEDLRRAVAFYTAAFGYAEVVTSPNYVELETDGTTGLGLYERVGFGRNIGTTPVAPVAGEVSRAELYFRVEALPAAIAKLEAAGARLLSPPQARPWGEVAAYFADPDGNVIAVAVPA